MATLIRSFREVLHDDWTNALTVGGQCTVADEMTWASLDDETQASIIRLCRAFPVEVDSFDYDEAYDLGYARGHEDGFDSVN